MMKRLFKILSFFSLSLFIISACGGRDLSNVKTSLYGHWKSEYGEDYYFDSERLLYNSTDEDTDEIEYKYTVLEHDEVKNLIVLDLIDDNGDGRTTEFIFSNDERDKMKSITEMTSYKSLHESDEDAEPLVEYARGEFLRMLEGKTYEVDLEYIDDSLEP